MRNENPLPEGATLVAAGLGISGIATFVYLGIANRVLPADDYTSVSVLWSLMFAVGNGVMQPLEQEVARAVSDRRSKGIGPGPVVRRAVRIGAWFSLVLCVLAIVTHDFLLDRLLDDDPVLLLAFVVGLVGFGAGHLARGTLSSHGRFRGYARFFATDGTSRVVLAAVLAAAGVAVAGPFGLVLCLAPFLAVAVALRGEHGLLEDGPDAHWAELSKALGWLLLGLGSLSLLIQGGTIAVDLLATDQQQAAAGEFLNGMQIARMPLFLFQAVLASLLPKLSHLAGRGRMDEFRSSLGRLVGTILAVGALTTLVATLIGPWVVGLIFGSETSLTARDLGLLAAASILIMVAICLDQALIALSGHTAMAFGWFTALGVFVVVTALGNDLFLRVELGLVSAAVWACCWMAFWLRRALRHRPPGPAEDRSPVDLAEALAEVPWEP